MSIGAVPVPAAEAATSEDVRAAARAFAQALGETPEFRAYEETAERLRNDEVAQKIMADLVAKQRSLQMLLRLDAVPAEDQAELTRHREAFYAQPAVTAHLKAQESLAGVCQAGADLLTQRIGLSFTTACGPGCC